ncbi:SAM-dependent methyltransferase [Acidobacteriota bacterium]
MTKKNIQAKNILSGLLFLFILMHWGTAGLQQKKPEVPYVPTPEEVIVEMLKIGDVGEHDVLYDLGCGDGRIVIKAVRELGCRGVGIDIDPVRIKECRENAANAGVSDRIEFFVMDLFEADISQASVVTLYLLSKVNLRLRPKLFRDLAPGTRVISHDFGMGEWEPDKNTTISNDDDKFPPVYDTFMLDFNWRVHNVYFWMIPANVMGTWQWTMPIISGNKRYSLKLDQEFQKITGTAFDGSSSIPVNIKNGKVEGNKLEFTLDIEQKKYIQKIHFDGYVKGHSIEGFVQIEGQPDSKARWRAERILSTFKPIDK